MFFWSAMPIKKDSKIFTIDLAMYFLKKIFKKLNKDIVFETDQPSLKFVNIHGKSKFIKFNLLKLIEWKSQE